MKHALFLAALTLGVSPFVNAQTDSTQRADFYPVKGDLGVAVNLTGLILNVSLNPQNDLRANDLMMVRYTVNDRFTFRIGVGPTMMRYRQIGADSVGKDLVETDTSARQSMLSIRPGLEWHLKGTRRLDPYFALDAEGGFIGKFNASSITQITDTTGTATFRRTISEAGGYSFGARAGAGLNYFVARNISVGAEYGIGIMSLSTGGDRQDVLQSEPVSGSATTTRSLSSTRVTDTRLFVDPTVRITFCYFFGI